MLIVWRGVLWDIREGVVAGAVFDGAGDGLVEVVGLEECLAAGIVGQCLHGALVGVMALALLRPLRGLGLSRVVRIAGYGGCVGGAELRWLPQAAGIDGVDGDARGGEHVGGLLDLVAKAFHVGEGVDLAGLGQKRERKRAGEPDYEHTT